MFEDEAALIAHGEAFVATSLPKARWTHEGHFAAALYLIARRPDIMPERDMPDMIRRYNLTTGVANTDTGGYHETITQASLIKARAFLATRPKDEPLHLTSAALMQSALGDKNWPLVNWTKQTLFSVEARRYWVAPDLVALD
jgi:hypothetical protein